MKLDNKRIVFRYSDGQLSEKEDQIVVEHPVTIKINDKEFATIVCSPEYIEDMAVGFLASEGVIPNYQDIKEIRCRKNWGLSISKRIKCIPFTKNCLINGTSPLVAE